MNYQYVTVSQAIKDGKKFSITPFENCAEDVVVHQYTGGTTGVAKGAMLTKCQSPCQYVTDKIMGSELSSQTDSQEVVLSPLPMYHIFAFTVNCMAMLGFGAVNVLVTNPRDIKKLVGEFKKNKITILTGVILFLMPCHTTRSL